jgi:hypothetical protein
LTISRMQELHLIQGEMCFVHRGPDAWNMLKELEKAVETIWESWKAPLRV